jgi:hypothetical protein
MRPRARRYRAARAVDADVELDLELRQLLLQPYDRQRNDGCAPERPCPDAKAPARTLRERLHLGVGEAALRVDQLRVGKQRRAERRQRHAACAALEKREAVVRFQPPDAFRERRLAHAEHLRAGTHASRFVNLHLYKVFFEQNRLGYGALLSLAVIAAIVAFLLVSRRAALAVGP